MGTGLLRRHREALAKLREQDAAQEIEEVITTVAEDTSPVEEPAMVAEETSKPTKGKGQKAK